MMKHSMNFPDKNRDFVSVDVIRLVLCLLLFICRSLSCLMTILKFLCPHVTQRLSPDAKDALKVGKQMSHFLSGSCRVPSSYCICSQK
jgi:hypothetical protein